jgi:hypothetical protein
MKPFALERAAAARDWTLTEYYVGPPCIVQFSLHYRERQPLNRLNERMAIISNLATHMHDYIRDTHDWSETTEELLRLTKVIIELASPALGSTEPDSTTDDE